MKLLFQISCLIMAQYVQTLSAILSSLCTFYTFKICTHAMELSSLFFPPCDATLLIIILYKYLLTMQAEDDTTKCCSTGDGCCGSDWELHCCNFVAKICCYGEKRVRALHHHNHRQWHLNRHCKTTLQKSSNRNWLNTLSIVSQLVPLVL